MVKQAFENKDVDWDNKLLNIVSDNPCHNHDKWAVAEAIENGANPNGTDARGVSVLFYAVHNEYHGAAKALVHGGADTSSLTTKQKFRYLATSFFGSNSGAPVQEGNQYTSEVVDTIGASREIEPV